MSGKDLLERARRLGTAAVSDALDSMRCEGVLSGIRPRVSSARVVGWAWTVSYEPVAASASPEHGFRNAANYLDEVPAGSVVVVDNAGRTDCTSWGSLLTARAIRRGIKGTVIHGSARDIAEVRDSGYPLFTTEITMVSGKNRVQLAGVGREVDIHGVLIAPGDLVVADDCGALRVPALLAPEVVERAWRVSQTEGAIERDVCDGVRLDEARRRHGYATPWAGAGQG